MAVHLMRFDPSLQRFARIAPPSDQAVLFRLWARVEGERELFDAGSRVGAKWESKDGSTITTEPVKSAVGPNSSVPPWQLLKVIEHQGKGRFEAVEWIQRVGVFLSGKYRQQQLQGSVRFQQGLAMRLEHRTS
jgi:hypothetical protein